MHKHSDDCRCDRPATVGTRCLVRLHWFLSVFSTFDSRHSAFPWVPHSSGFAVLLRSPVYQSHKDHDHAHASSAQCLHPEGDDRALLSRRCDESQHARRQSLRKRLHGRMSFGTRLRVYSVGDGRAMVPRKRTRCNHSARCFDLPLGSHGDSCDGNRSLYGEFYGTLSRMINVTKP